MALIGCDVSEYQSYYNSTYPHQWISFRADSGYGMDAKVRTNWARIKADLARGKLQFAITYVVYIPGREQATFNRVRAVFGAKPDRRLAVMIDMESGKYFAGPGNHSAGANHLFDLFAAWLGAKRVTGYANGGDWRNNWPSRRAGMKRFIAGYSSQNQGGWGWQYSDGQTKWPVPAGYPRSSAPFGHCDHNVINRTLPQALADLGITVPSAPSGGGVPVPSDTEDDDMIVVTVDEKECAAAKVRWPGTFTFNGSTLKHVAPPSKTNSNTSQILAACGQKKPAVITVGQYREWGGK